MTCFNDYTGCPVSEFDDLTYEDPDFGMVADELDASGYHVVDIDGTDTLYAANGDVEPMPAEMLMELLNDAERVFA